MGAAVPAVHGAMIKLMSGLGTSSAMSCWSWGSERTIANAYRGRATLSPTHTAGRAKSQARNHGTGQRTKTQRESPPPAADNRVGTSLPVCSMIARMDANGDGQVDERE